jgi:hypothetical protein
MSRIHVTVLFALSTLALPASFAGAQQIFSAGSAQSTGSQGTTGKAVPHCQAAPGGSRMRSRRQENCLTPEQVAAEAEQQAAAQQLNVAVEAPPQPEVLQCEATTLTEYEQRGNIARVIKGGISIANCPGGSTGTFDVVARVKDDSGETKPIEFHETWQREDAQDVSFNGDYPIGDNVELVSLRVRNLKCACADAPQAATAEPAAQN